MNVLGTGELCNVVRNSLCCCKDETLCKWDIKAFNIPMFLGIDALLLYLITPCLYKPQINAQEKKSAVYLSVEGHRRVCVPALCVWYVVMRPQHAEILFMPLL